MMHCISYAICILCTRFYCPVYSHWLAMVGIYLCNSFLTMKSNTVDHLWNMPPPHKERALSICIHLIHPSLCPVVLLVIPLTQKQVAKCSELRS